MTLEFIVLGRVIAIIRLKRLGDQRKMIVRVVSDFLPACEHIFISVDIKFTVLFDLGVSDKLNRLSAVITNVEKYRIRDMNLLLFHDTPIFASSAL